MGPGFEPQKVHQYIVSSHNAQGTPVPIPNTEVKLRSADDTGLATARNNRSELTKPLRLSLSYSSIAQWQSIRLLTGGL